MIHDYGLRVPAPPTELITKSNKSYAFDCKESYFAKIHLCRLRLEHMNRNIWGTTEMLFLNK